MYSLSFELKGLPKMTNQLARGNWRTKHANAKKWKDLVRLICVKYLPDKPLKKAVVTLTRCSSFEPDSDGLVSGFKHVIDGLVECGVLENDKSSNIGFPIYLWEKASPGKGFIKVQVLED